MITRFFKRLLADKRGAMAITASHMFLGSVSIGIGLMRGTDSYAAFHHETNVGHANYGASKLAHDHSRSSNVVVNQNVVMTAIMGPRMGVESDNITMDGNAMIACPQCPYGMCKVCIQYKANKPRAIIKQVWVRAKQQLLWSALGKMNGEVDKLAFGAAQGLITGDVSKMDPKVNISMKDPSSSGDIWGGSAKPKACDLAKDDTMKSPVLGHAFPILITPNLLEGMPRALVQAMPGMLCGGGMGGMGGGMGGLGGMMGGMGGGGGSSGGSSSGGLPSPSDIADKIKLPGIPVVAEKSANDCRELENQMKAQVSNARGEFDPEADFESTIQQVGGKVSLSKEVKEFMTCGTRSSNGGGGGYAYRTANAVVTCSFDRAKCTEKQLEKNSEDFLKQELGLAKNSTPQTGNDALNKVQSMIQGMGGMGGGGQSMPGIGSDEPRKPAAGGSSPKNFCACATTKKPVDQTVIGITNAIRKISSFGQVGDSQVLTQQHEYQSCGKWYFPDKKGQFASVGEEDQPFVGAWKWALVKECQQ